MSKRNCVDSSHLLVDAVWTKSENEIWNLDIDMNEKEICQIKDDQMMERKIILPGNCFHSKGY